LWFEFFTSTVDCTSTSTVALINMTVGKCWKTGANESLKITECSEGKIKYDYHSTKGDCNGGTISKFET